MIFFDRNLLLDFFDDNVQSLAFGSPVRSHPNFIAQVFVEKYDQFGLLSLLNLGV